jgi:hypothetical protein
MMIKITSLMLLASVLGAPHAAAQTRLTWPDSSPHIERYATAEQCLSAVGRVRDSLDQHSIVWGDTLALTREETLAPLPPIVRETARRCGGGALQAATAPLADFAPLLQLYLLSGDDSGAAALVARRLKSIPAAADRERASVFDSLVSAYLAQPYEKVRSLAAQPARLADADRWLSRLGTMTTASPWPVRQLAYALLMDAAWDAGDSARVRKGADGVLAIGRALTPADRRSNDFPLAELTMYRAMGRLHEFALLDSLRHGTAGYVALQRTIWSAASGERPDAMRFPLGEPAPPLEGQFWFRRGDSTGTRPTKGKVSLVVFLAPKLCTESNRYCWIAYAALHRLATRFPRLEITLVSETRGYVSNMAPPTPAQEAETLRHFWLDRDQLPGALVVAVTDYWRLPAPDRRRIDRDVPNRVHYSFGRTWVTADGPEAYLVDRQGTIVDVRNLTLRSEERRLAEILEVVFAQ